MESETSKIDNEHESQSTSGSNLCSEVNGVEEREQSASYFAQLSTASSGELTDSMNLSTNNGTLLDDDALSAAMEAIAEANRLTCSKCESGPCQQSPPAITVAPVTLDSSEKAAGDVTSDTDTGGREDDEEYFSPNAVIMVDGKSTPIVSSQSNNTVQRRKAPPPKTTMASSSLPIVPKSPINPQLSVFQTNWRPVLRPVFEKALIERLWTRGELGSSSPQALLLSMWFCISRHFGVGCRTDHVRLMYGNFKIFTDSDTGLKQVHYVRIPHSLVSVSEPKHGASSSEDGDGSLRPRHPENILNADSDKPHRCPVALFEAFYSHRPSSANYPTSPFYLQPERTPSNSKSVLNLDSNIWYSSNALGKNKIGSMLNVALQNIGMPISRQVNLLRFCDALAAAALTPAGGCAGMRLAELTSNCRQNISSDQLQEEMAICAERIVDESTTPGSAIYQLLIKACATKPGMINKTQCPLKSTPVKQSGPTVLNGSVTGGLRTFTVSPGSRVSVITQLPNSTTHPNRVLLRPVNTLISHIRSKQSRGQEDGSRSKSSQRNDLDSKTDLSCSFDSHSIENQQLLTQMFQDTTTFISSSGLHDSNQNNPHPSVFGLSSIASSQSDLTVTSASYLGPAMVLLPSLSDGSHNLDSEPVTVASALGHGSVSSTLPLDENLIDITNLAGIDHLMPVTIISTTPTKSALIKTNEEQFGSRAGNGGSPCNDDIRIDLRKSGGGPGRSVRIELRDLLDLVLAAARPSATTSSDGSLGSQRPPVGLVTQLLWRSRALDDRGPWILTFSMWWLMQHYFGVGSRMHHVRLRWGHLRIVSGVRDPMTNELCDAIEYVGPPEFTTVKACAVLETTAESTRVRRVYPSSGWAEAEITVASALTCEDIAERPRMRPLDTEPDVPTVCRRPGPNFVELFKAFAERRQDQSLLSSAPFYVQPLQSSSGLVNKSTATWFSVSALGKNRIGALMRNIVDKVVRPNLSRVATAATAVAKKACIAVAHRAALAIPVPLDGPTPDFLAHRRTLTVKLACLLGLTVASLNEPEDQSPPDSACSSPCVDEAAADSFTLSASCQIDVSPSPAVDMNELMGDLIRDNSSSISSALPRLGVKSSEMSERSNAGATHHAIGISPSNPTAGLMLLTSADGHSTVQSSAPPGSLIILPTQSSTGTVGFVQPNLSSQQSQHRTVIHAAQPATVLTTPGTQFVKTQNLSSYPARSAASQQVAYLTSGAGINQSPVNLIFLSTNTSQGTAILPSSVMLSNFQGQQQQHQQPTVAVYQSGQGTYQTATSLTQLPTDRIRSVLVRRGFGGTINILSPSKSEATHLLCSTSVPHSSTTTTANVTTTIPMGSQLFYSTSNTVNSDYTYPEQTIIKQEQASPGIGVYDTSSSTPTVTSNPVILQAVTPDGQVIHIAQAATHEGQKQQQIFIQSQHSNQVYARTNNMNTMVTMYDENGGAMGNLGSGGSDCEVIFSPVGNECGSNQTVDQTTYEIMEQPVVLDSTTAAGKADTTSASTCTTLPSPNSSLLSSKRGSGVFGRTQLPSVIHITRGTPAVRIISSKAISQPERVNSSTLPPLSSMTCQLVPPEPKQEQLHTLQSVINTASAYQCADFPSYVEQLFRSGVLSARNPWCLNFTAWFINSLVFEIENRTEHVNLRWGDFQLCQTFDGTEFIYFINHVNNKEYYLAESPPSPYSLGYDDDGCAGGKPGSRTSVRCPCPVAIFKALREHRPTHCLEPYSKFYLQPRNTDNSENSTKAGIKPTPSTSDNTDWFTEHAWGKNKLGGLFAEAAKLAKLPMIWLRKHRSRNFFPGGGGSGMGALGHHSPPRGVGFNSRSQSCATNKMGSSTKASSTPNTRKSRPRSDAKRRRLSTPTVTTSEPDELIHSSSSSQTPAPPIQLPSSSTILKRKASSFLSPNC